MLTIKKDPTVRWGLQGEGVEKSKPSGSQERQYAIQTVSIVTSRHMQMCVILGLILV